MKILIVDDEPMIIEVLLSLIDKKHEIVFAHTYEEAINRLDVDLAIIDSLSGAGVQLAEICKSLNIKTILHTGSSNLIDMSFFDLKVQKPNFDLLTDFIENPSSKLKM